MTPLEGARRKNHALDSHAIVRALHDLHALGGRRATLRQLQNHLGNRFTDSDISAALDASLVTDHGDGTYELTDAGLVEARTHPSDRSWS